MSFGPRLDRPSAVGEEGRPRATSLWVAAALAVALSLTVFRAAWSARVVLALLLPIGLVSAGMALLSRENFPAKFFGHICFFPAAIALVGVVPVVFVFSAYGFLVLGLVVSLVGVSATWADSANEQSLRRTTVQTSLVYLTTVLSVLAIGVAAAVGWGGFRVVGALTASTRPTQALVGLELVVALSALGVRIGLWALPIRQLTPGDRRAGVDHVLGRVELACALLAVGAIVAAIGTGLLAVTGLTTLVFGAVPLLGRVLTVLVVRPLTIGLLALGGAGVALAVLSLSVRTLTKRFDRSSARNVAALAAGIVFSVGLPPLVFLMLPGGGPLMAVFAVLLTVFGPLALLGVLGTSYALVASSVVPDRSLGPALSAAGLVALAVGAGDAGLAAPFVLAAAAGAMVVWDLSSFGLGVTAELGHVPETRRLELFHAVVAVGLGLVAAATLSGLAYLLTEISPEGSVPAAVVVAGGVALLVWTLRG
jgi:hypothetical protein